MSLFPAYSNTDGETSKDETGETSQNWLNCSSFPENTIDAVQDKIKDKTRKRKKDDKDEGKELFYEDTGPRAKIPPSVPQIQLTKPRYVRPAQQEKKKPKKKKKPKSEDRYFDKLEVLDETVESSISVEEFTKRTAELNQILRDEPNNVDKWLEYVKLQDLGEGHKRAKIEKKLSILDKALKVNAQSEQLLEQKMFLMEKIYTYDKINSEAKIIVGKYPSSRIGWKWLVSSVLFNLSKMTAPGVLNAYAAVLQRVHRQPSDFILEVLFECGIFLRQAGLWEQLCTFLQIYLEMSFTVAGSGGFKLNINMPEQEIREIEDKVITSGLTLTELWLRVEHMRSGVYFLPLMSEDNLNEDPQRVVLPEDLSHLLYPLSKESRPKLSMIVLLLLKVPLLPCTESMYEFIGLKNIPWALESPEMLFSSAISSYGLVQNDEGCLETLKELLVNPQYLVDKTGEKQFLEAVDNMFQNILKYCDDELMPLMILQVRWWRLLIKVKKINGKPYKSRAKKLLKEYRDFLPLYTEYALLEELDDFNSAQRVLEMAIELHNSPQNVGSSDKSHLCLIYRVYIEMMLRKDFESNKEKALKPLIALSFGEKINNITSVSQDLATKALIRFDHVTTELILETVKNDEDETELTLSDFMTEPYIVSWISCNVWLSYITNGTAANAKHTLNKAIDQMSSCRSLKSRFIIEGIYEIYVDLLHHSFTQNIAEYSELCDILIKAIERFPNNTKFLHILANIKVKGIKWKKMSSTLISTGSCISALYSFLVLHSYNSNKDSLNTMTKESAYNQMKSHLGKTVQMPQFERCPILWRLLLQCSSPLPPPALKKVYYHALEKCPWVKILYYEAGKILPQDLPEIQDLIVEKELRLHITPEELEILREDEPPQNQDTEPATS